MGYDLNNALTRYPIPTWSFNNLAGMEYSDFIKWNSFLNFNTQVDLGYILNPSSPSEYILSQKLYPFNVLQFFNGKGRQQIKLGVATDTGVNCFSLSSQSPSLKLFEVAINETITTPGCKFINYEPHTEIQLYVPFFGWIDLPVNEVMNKTLTGYITVDFNSGEGMLILTTTYENTTRLLLTSVNQLGYDIPIGSTNSREVIANYYRQWVSLGTSAVSMVAGLKGGKFTSDKVTSQEVIRRTKGGTNRRYTLENTESTTTKFTDPARYTGVATKEVNDILSGNSLSAHVSRGNSNNVLNNFALTNNVLLVIKQPNLVLPSQTDYEHLYGYACLTSGTLNDHNTSENQNLLFRFDEIELNQIPKATQEEMTLIHEALQGGVHL